MKRKIILFGIDGATWLILNKYIAEGLLPNFDFLVKNGSYGNLMSTAPPLTLPAWTSIFSGTNPGKHGLVGFRMKIDGKFTTIGTKDPDVESLWRILTRHGLKSIVVNSPVDYVPEKINGIMTTGLLTVSKSNYVYPKEIANEIEKVANGYMYEVPLEFYDVVAHDRDKAYTFLDRFIRCTARVSSHLAHNYEWDIIAPIFTSTDRLQHFYWDDEYVKKHYVMLDRILKEFLDIAARENADIFVVSDHGFGPYKRTFFTNTMLERLGLLKVEKNRIVSLLSRLGMSQYSIIHILHKTHLYGIASHLAQTRFKKLERMALFFDREIDFEKSLAYSMTEFGIFINKTVKGKQYEEVVDKIMLELNKIEENGKKVINKVYRKEEVMWGKYLSRAPDIFIECKEGYGTSDHASPDLFGEARDLKGGAPYAGTHRPEGIFIAYGPNIRSGLNVGSIPSWNIAPTMLHLLELPIPTQMDGTVVEQIFKHPIGAGYISHESTDEKDRVRQKLNRLAKK
ncbi:MAG: alkaline phosphatase family protein [Nitrososphaerales archaeon]